MYRIVSTSQNKYLTIERYNEANNSGPKGSVGIAEYQDGNDDQVFTLEDAGNGKYYLLSASGYYIVCRQWNVDASNTGEKSALGIEYLSDNSGQFYIMNGTQYFKVGPVDGDATSYYPYCDAPFDMAEAWMLESATTTGIEEVKAESGELKGIYDLSGRKLDTVTEPGIYIINGKKMLVK